MTVSRRGAIRRLGVAAAAPTLPTGGCTNATLTFVALALRSAERIAPS